MTGFDAQSALPDTMIVASSISCKNTRPTRDAAGDAEQPPSQALSRPENGFASREVDPEALSSRGGGVGAEATVVPGVVVVAFATVAMVVFTVDVELTADAETVV